MYRSCIFCSAALGANESIERFPVGRSLAFDAAKGRLWAVCPKCARWNLAPLEERWEAIENAERLFHDTRLRVQRENIGLAKLRDGTRLVRVGRALPGELAAWRYGRALVGRRRRYVALTVPMTALGVAGGALLGGAPHLLVGGAVAGYQASQWLRDMTRPNGYVTRLTPADAPIPEPMRVYREHLQCARLVTAEDGSVGVELPALRQRHVWTPEHGARVLGVSVVIAGQPARRLLNRVMVVANERGAGRQSLLQAADDVAAAGSPEAYLHCQARNGQPLFAADQASEGVLAALYGTAHVPGLALEMALHEETERRALHGELAMLEAMWREAEEIASIADRLPDLPAPEPPRVGTGG